MQDRATVIVEQFVSRKPFRPILYGFRWH